MMIDTAERVGLLKPGGTIVEPTSGNTGVGLAIVACRRGLSLRVSCALTRSQPTRSPLLRAYGAEVIVCPTSVPPEHPESYYSVSDRLAPRDPRRVEARPVPQSRQSAGRSTRRRDPRSGSRPAAGSRTSSPGVGTGGTISGIGRYLKERNPDVQVIGADPEGSVYSGGSGRPYLVEGIGEDFWPTTYDPTVVDRIIAVSDSDSFATARRVTREEGILLGGSGGTAIAAALVTGRELPADAVIVVHIPDSGRGYLSKLYNDAWMADHGFLRATGRHRGRATGVPRPVDPRAGPHPPRRDGAGSDRHPSRVRHQPDAGRQARAAGRARRGRRGGDRAGSARACLRRRHGARALGLGGDGTAVCRRSAPASRSTWRSHGWSCRPPSSCWTGAIPVGVVTRSDALAALTAPSRS